jgi:hypothetical protein
VLDDAASADRGGHLPIVSVGVGLARVRSAAAAGDHDAVDAATTTLLATCRTHPYPAAEAAARRWRASDGDGLRAALAIAERAGARAEVLRCRYRLGDPEVAAELAALRMRPDY